MNCEIKQSTNRVFHLIGEDSLQYGLWKITLDCAQNINHSALVICNNPKRAFEQVVGNLTFIEQQIIKISKQRKFIRLENGSGLIFSSSINTVRGCSFNSIFLDTFTKNLEEIDSSVLAVIYPSLKKDGLLYITFDR